jgi:hypothetical protein
VTIKTLSNMESSKAAILDPALDALRELGLQVKASPPHDGSDAQVVENHRCPVEIPNR